MRLPKFLSIAIVFAAGFLFFAFLQAYPTVLDPDSFYHLKVSQMIMERGLIGQHFPWLAFTTLADNYADQHLLYHLALIPFLKFFGPLFGGKLATIIFGAAAISLIYALLRSWQVRWAWLYAILALLNYHFVFRLNLIKASGFAIALLLIGLFLMTRKKYFWLLIVSFLYVWAHGGFIIILAAAGIWAISSAIFAILSRGIVPLHMRSRWAIIRDFFYSLFSKDNLYLALSIIGGVAIGVAAHPDRIAIFNFLGQQLVQIGFFTKISQLRVGSEWFPFSLQDFFQYNGAVVFIYSLALVFFVVRKESRTPKSLFLLILSSIFLLFTIRSKRFIEYFIPLALLFAGLSLNDLPWLIRQFWQEFKKPAYVWAVGVLSFFLVVAAIIFSGIYNISALAKSFRGGNSFYEHRGAAEWLSKNSNPGDVVFNSDWDVFPPLFYYNTENYYIVGLDPTFMYNFNPTLSKLYDEIILGRKRDGLSEVMAGTFQSNYVYVAKKSGNLRDSLLKSGEFIKLYEDSDGEIYTPSR